MNRKKEPFLGFVIPKINQMDNYKRRLRIALMTAHEDRSVVRMFGEIVSTTIQTMSKLQKVLVAVVLVAVGVVVTAGILGPSASSVAHAEAQDTINRAFVRIASLTDEERAELERKFQDRIQFQGGPRGGFMGMEELSPEEIEARHQEIKASLAEALIEAQSAPDLRVISADEVPVPGFLGRTGRAFGFKMTTHNEDPEDKLANLPEDIRTHIKEHEEIREEMNPVSFLVYTNSDGQKVTLGINASDEPIIKFIQPADGNESMPVMPFSYGKGMPFSGFKESAE